MKKFLPGISILAFLVVLLSSFIRQSNDNPVSPVREIKAMYLRNLIDFRSETERLQEAATSLNQEDASSLKHLQKVFKQTRFAYKKVEYLADYLDAQFVDDFINGPPLLSLERNAPSLSILEPEGMQVLEEYIFSESAYAEKEKIVELTTALTGNSQELAEFQSRVYLTDRHIFEAARFQMIRTISLGLTGFDSPVTLNSIPEAEHVWEAIYEAIKLYYVLLEMQEPALKKNLDDKFKGGIKYMNDHQNFDTFDRLTFLRDYVNPIYKLLLEAQLALHIETYYETPPLTRKYSVNYFATNIFAEDFLNPYYYTRLQKGKADEGVVELGRMLFFDPILSENKQRSCASCHQPAKGFTDSFTKSLATDFKGTVDRNAPTLFNAAYADRFFYDLRADHLEDQIDHVIADHREFGTSYLDIFNKLNQSEEYVELFQKAFPEVQEAPVNKYTLSSALAAYVISLKSFNAPFDQYVRGETETLDPKVKEGFNIFMGKAACGTCHFAPLFNGTVPPLYHESESEVLGVPATTDTLNPILDPDLGRFHGVLKEHAPFFKHSFKTTTIRNIALTTPYMHNGVYQTLEEVIEFYNRGGGIGLGLDVPNQTLPPDPLNLTDQEKQNLVAFLESLTDTTVQRMPKRLPVFSNQPEWNNRKIGGNY